jgi:hypothetical protein
MLTKEQHELVLLGMTLNIPKEIIAEKLGVKVSDVEEVIH